MRQVARPRNVTDYRRGQVGSLEFDPAFHAGLLYARNYHGRMEQFRTDLLSGMSPGQLVARHVASLDPCPFWGYPNVGVQLARGDSSRIDDA